MVHRPLQEHKVIKVHEDLKVLLLTVVHRQVQVCKVIKVHKVP